MKRIQRVSVLILIVLFLGTINWVVLNDHYILKSVIKPTSSIIVQNEFHPPLFINGNNEFYLTAIKEGWKGNGSLSSPYIIDSLTITYYYGRLLIDIQNTNVYFKISNCVLTLGFHGIFLKNVTNGIITNNLISNNTHGIFLIESNNNTLVGNTIISNENTGIHLIFSENNTLIGNTLINNGNIGIYLEASIYNSVLDNILINNSFQVWRYITPYAMPKFEYFQLLEVVNNSVNGKPIIYWQNRIGETVPSGAGQIFLINCRSIKVENQDFSRNTGGIVAVFSSDIKISYNTFSDATRIHFQEVTNSSINFNTIINSNDEGISLFNSRNCTVSNNTISNNNNFGILLSYSNEINLVANEVDKNWDGIYLSNSYNNTITENIFSNNRNYGVYLSFSNNNTLYNNSIMNNDEYGVYINHFSKNNIIQNNSYYENNVGNTQAADDGSNNKFSFNFWDDWIGPDEDKNGIVDKPYAIEGTSNNNDSFPLASPSSSTKTMIPDLLLRGILFFLIITSLGLLLLKLKFKN